MTEVKIEEVTMFKTPDGAVFNTHAEAEGHFVKGDFIATVQKHFFADHPDDEHRVGASEIVDFIVERQADIVSFLQHLGKTNGKA